MMIVDDIKYDTPLAQSLLTIASLPNCPYSPDFFLDVPTDCQPRPLKGMPDNADYFVRNETEPLVMIFPAEIDHNGSFSRLAPYFSLPRSVRLHYTIVYHLLTFLSAQIDLNDLRRARAQFELRLLNDSDSPPVAIKASRAAYEVALALYNEVESERKGCTIYLVFIPLFFLTFIP